MEYYWQPILVDQTFWTCWKSYKLVPKIFCKLLVLLQYQKGGGKIKLLVVCNATNCLVHNEWEIDCSMLGTLLLCNCWDNTHGAYPQGAIDPHVVYWIKNACLTILVFLDYYCGLKRWSMPWCLKNLSTVPVGNNHLRAWSHFNN